MWNIIPQVWNWPVNGIERLDQFLSNNSGIIQKVNSDEYEQSYFQEACSKESMPKCQRKVGKIAIYLF